MLSSHGTPSATEEDESTFFIQHSPSPFSHSILDQHHRLYSHQTQPTSPTHEIHCETSSVDLKLCRPSNQKSFPHPLAPPRSFSHHIVSTVVPPTTIKSARTVFGHSQIEQYSLAEISSSQTGDFMDISPAAKLTRDQSRLRIRSLDKGEKIWREGGLRSEFELDLDAAIQMRRSMIEWIWNVDLKKHGFEISTTMRYLAVHLLTLFYADLDILPAITRSTTPPGSPSAPIDSTRRISQSSSESSLTVGEFEVVKTACAALALAMKFEQDFTSPLFAFGYTYFIRGLPVIVEDTELIKLEREILKSPTINYGFPVTPLDYLFELSISVPFFVQLREAYPEVWRAVLDAVPGLLRCAAVSDSRFITMRPKILLSAILVISVESLPLDLFPLENDSSSSSSSATSSTSSSSTTEKANDYEDDIAYDIALQEEAELAQRARINSTPTPVSYLSYRHLLTHGYDPTDDDEEMEILEADGRTKGDASISRWAYEVEERTGYPSPESEEMDEGAREEKIVEVANVFLVTLCEELNLVQDEIENCLIWLRNLNSE